MKKKLLVGNTHQSNLSHEGGPQTLATVGWLHIKGLQPHTKPMAGESRIEHSAAHQSSITLSYKALKESALRWRVGY